MKVNALFINLTSEQPDKLLAFYRDVVGLTPKPEAGEHSFELGPGATLGIDGHSDTHGHAKEPSRVLIDLFVDDVKAERERLEAHGIVFSRKEGVEEWGGVISTFSDPDGNCCQVIQFKPELANAQAQ